MSEAREQSCADDGEAQVLSLRDPRALKCSRVGAKAAGLSGAMAAGHEVPEGVVVTEGALGQRFERALEEALDELGEGPFAVRSSATNEDGATRSFAGQLETVLSVPRVSVRAMIERCRRSAGSLRALSYGDPGSVAVIVQRMVSAKAAGVAFSVDPRSGERVVVLEATAGLADQLVSGAIDAESWRCADDQRATRVRSLETTVLDEPTARRVAALARSIEALFGSPQDIEWALDERSLWLVQARPITALPAEPVPIASRALAGDWERDDHHGVLSPLGWDWFQPYAQAIGARLRSVGIPVEAVHTARYEGHLYLQMVMPGGSASPPAWLLWVLARVVPSMRRSNRACAAMLDSERELQELDRWERETRPSLRARVDALFVERPAQLSDDALLDRIRAAMQLCTRGLELHAALSIPTMLSIGKLQLFAEEHLGWRGARVLEVLSGSSSSTTAAHRAIAEIVRAHDDELRACGALAPRWAALAEQCPRLAAALADWLRENQLRVLHYDPANPTFAERPELLLSMVHAAAAQRGLAASERAEPEALRAAREQLRGDARATFERLLANARRGYALRDDNGVDAVSRPAGLLRWFVLELGRRLSPALASAEHAVYLHAHEHEPALRGALTDLAQRVARRRGEESWASRRRPPKRFGAAPAAIGSVDAFPSGLRRMMRIFAWIMELEAPAEDSIGEALRGVGVGARVVTARARVIERPSALDELRPGEVLVCRITSPEWSIALGRAAAIVTDEGALLSHPAIIAREFDIPAVLGAATATQRIRTGDTVRVDPVEGSVTVLA